MDSILIQHQTEIHRYYIDGQFMLTLVYFREKNQYFDIHNQIYSR